MLNVKDLKEQIKGLPDDTAVFIRCHVNPVGDIIEAAKADYSNYSFFGKPVPCIIIEPIQDED